MVWGRTSDRQEHARRSKALTANYESPAGLPVYDRDGLRGGSRGGAPIWVMREVWMAKGRERRDRACTCPSSLCLKHGFDNQRRGAADPDGFAVFGRYPKGFLAHVLKLKLLGDVQRQEILHVCSGTLGPTERLREAARVCTGGGYIGILHVAIPFVPPSCRLVTVYGISTGVGFRIRAFTVYRKTQDGLPL